MDRKEIIGNMTLRQKADFLTGKDFWQTREYPELGITSMFLSDGPHGLRKQAAAADHLGLNPSIPSTCFPTAATMANSWNTELGEEMGKALGEEAASLNVNVLLGPGINVKRNPRCGRNFEYFSEDPYLAGKMAAAYIRGIQANGTAACVKHFACNNQEERRMVSDSVVDERTLRELYLTAFEIAVKEGGTKALMSSYNRINGTFADENTYLMDVLRGEWGYDGVVVSDWAGCNNKVASTKAGSDLEMPACRYGADDIVEAVENGTLDISAVDKSVERLLELMESTSAGKKGEPFNKYEHNALARRCAEESIVLLKNDGVLPLDNSVRVAIVGDFAYNPRYQGAGSSIVNPTILSRFTEIVNPPKNKTYSQSVGTAKNVPIAVVENIVEDVSEYSLNIIGYEQGYERYGKPSEKLEKNALALTEKAEAVLFFAGLDEVSEAEGLDRENTQINENQINLYKKIKATGKKVIIMLTCGSSVDLTWADDADAIVYACLSGQACADAMLNVVTGKINPSGKLAESFPVKYSDCSSASRFPGHEMTVEYREGLYVGYRYYDTAKIKVAYPFGYGLSYTTFGYSDLKLTDEGATFKITNTGAVDGAEVAQLYVGKPDGKIFRPDKELKGFKKVFLKAGESVEAEISFDDKTFRYFNVFTKKWEVEGGDYVISVGASSQDIRLSGSVSRQGTTDILPYDKDKLPSYFSGKVADVGDEEFAALLGRPIPPSGYKFYKKNRMVIGENSTVADLRYSKRWVGRLFSAAIRFAIWFSRATGNRTQANTLVQGMLHQPVRGLAKYSGMSRRQMEALIMIFNGHFFKGAIKFITKQKGGNK
ncbi:MAG: beta-glucosidase [Candidatus Coproplasma sp.]